MTTQEVIDFFTKLEGPYRWYAIGGVLIVLTALVSRFVFKTLKWFLLFAALVIVMVGIGYYVIQFLGE